MKFSIDDPQDGLTIQSYSNSTIVINGRAFNKSLALVPDKLLEHDFPAEIAALEEQHFSRLAELQPQVVLLGTGEKQHFPPAALYALLINQGVGVEVMSTPSACRTYNILKAEGRRVCALLLLDAAD